MTKIFYENKEIAETKPVHLIGKILGFNFNKPATKDDCWDIPALLKERTFLFNTHSLLIASFPSCIKNSSFYSNPRLKFGFTKSQ
jgi:hypothetical protein